MEGRWLLRRSERRGLERSDAIGTDWETGGTSGCVSMAGETDWVVVDFPVSRAAVAIWLYDFDYLASLIGQPGRRWFIK
jgi:hypothetical protein